MTVRLDAVSIVVADMAASLSFYRALGCNLPPSADDDSHVEWTAPGGMRVLWDTVGVVRSFAPDWRPAEGGPNATLAFACDSAAEVDDVVARLAKAGHVVEREPWDAVWGQRYATVLDPDGNAVDVFAPLT